LLLAADPGVLMQPTRTANHYHEREGKTMTTASLAPTGAPAPEVLGKVFRAGLSLADFVHQEVSKMTMFCRWVHADDGALVMDWTAAESTAVQRGTGGTEAADAFEVFDHNTDALTPVRV
jgi:hypothetical protein